MENEAIQALSLADNETIQAIALMLGAAWASGINLYAAIATLGIFGCGYLALLAVFIPPGIAYWNSLSRIFLFQQHGFFWQCCLALLCSQ
ncbi:MAG: hypothetical protein P8Z31_12340 [Gammaproteobacteria bacterium]